jgi:hypothetical protein
VVDPAQLDDEEVDTRRPCLLHLPLYMLYTVFNPRTIAVMQPVYLYQRQSITSDIRCNKLHYLATCLQATGPHIADNPLFPRERHLAPSKIEARIRARLCMARSKGVERVGLTLVVPLVGVRVAVAVGMAARIDAVLRVRAVELALKLPRGAGRARCGACCRG